MDLFASRLNHQVPQYVSSYLDPGALAVDAFLQGWSKWTFNPPPCRSSSSDLEKDQSRPGNYSPNFTELGRATMVPGASSDACGSTSTASPAPILAVPPISTCSSTPPVAITSPNRLAPLRNRYKATGFSNEVINILLASWVTAPRSVMQAPGRHGFAGVPNGVSVPFQLL